ncbi:hypothetical protein N3K66_006410 [Trichothecium roseum]|uniref:Uncharacterized protein n=1 Tax=Trichothecium roseum TaxID=47278 RepID=A0ACC0UX26_9HYPO|nr:hypothetical protein N3K66_006410 [Trichothecium roseum]
MELEQISIHVEDLVDYLLRTSITIRSPAPHARLFASSAAANLAHYEKYDVEHVRSKFPGVDGWLAERLSQANTRRREYFKYRKAHRKRLAQGLAGEEEAGGAPSTKASSLPDTPDSGQMRLLLRPLEADKGPFECPLCFMIVTISDTRSWKKHVFGDLRPYMCLEETCSCAGQEFERRREWLFHMKEAHWRTYHCPSGCGKWFASRAKCRQHVEATHAMQIPPGCLDAQIKLHSEDINDESSLACPLCGEEQRSVKLYQRHVGRHQEQLSLFALPSLESEESDADSSTSSSSSSSSKSSRKSNTGRVHDLPGKDEDKDKSVATPPHTAEALFNTHDAALDSARPMMCGFCTDKMCQSYTASGIRAHVEEEHAELYKLTFARCYLGKDRHSLSPSTECGICKGLFYNPKCPGRNFGFCIISDQKGGESSS